jgi:hypothetical protein
MISTRSVGLLIDTVVCLTLAKWETVSGRFGGYLIVPHKGGYSPLNYSTIYGIQYDCQVETRKKQKVYLRMYLDRNDSIVMENPKRKS